MPKEMCQGTPQSHTSPNLSPGHGRACFKNWKDTPKSHSAEHRVSAAEEQSEGLPWGVHWETPQQKGTLELGFDEGTDV